MRKIKNLFSVPVLEAIVSEVDNIQLLLNIEETFNKLDTTRVLGHYWNHNIETHDPSDYGYSSFNDPQGNLVKNPNFNHFYDQIGQVVTEFFSQLGYNGSWHYTNSWAAVYPKGGFVPRHDHGNVHWSGVYYVNVVDPNSEIIFDDPKEYALSNEPDGFNVRGAKTAAFSPCNGKLLVWPGYVKHYTLPNSSEDARVIISFNIMCDD